MTTHDRHHPPDSTNPEEEQPTTWFANHASTVVIGLILFATILTGTLFLGFRHIETATLAALTSDKATASLLAAFIEEHNKATLAILQSYANRQQFIAAVKNKELTETGRQLSDMQSSANIDMTFVTDPEGILWINSPYFPQTRGKDFSHREWYQGISSQWQPYISSVFKLIVADQPLAVAVCVPVHDEQKRAIGILGSSKRLEFIKETIEVLPLLPDSLVSVVDRTGHMLYSNSYSYRQQLAKHPLSSDILAATQENTLQLTIIDQEPEWDKRYLTVAPISYGWSVIIERSRWNILRAEKRHLLEMGGAALLVFTLAILFLAYLQKITLFKKTEKLLQAEQELRALSARQEAILAAVPEIIMEVDTSKVYTWANSVGKEFFGEDVLGKEASFYFEGRQDTYNKVDPLFLGSEEKIYVESWQRRHDGEKRLLAWWCRCLKDAHGNVRGVLSSGYDITEQKNAEDKFRHIFDSSVTGISITLPSGEVDVNPAFAAMLGYEVAELKNVKWQVISYPGDTEATRQAIQPLLDGNKISARFIKRYLHRNGTTVWADVGTTLRRDNVGTPLYFVSTIADITQQKKAEEEKRLYIEALARSNTELQQFAHVASHDLQEPLRMISSYLQLLERRYKDKLDDDANTFIEYAVDGARRMQALINGLLEFSRIKTHGQEFLSVDVKTVVDGVCRNLQSMIAEAGAVVHYGELPIIIGDEAQIARLFQNLLQNALKFRRKDVPPIIDIGAEKTDAGQVFVVRDNGIGIEEQYFKRIFTIFQRLHTRDEYPGTGMGLSICKRIVERHGGRIWLESNPGTGTSFYFSIPGEKI